MSTVSPDSPQLASNTATSTGTSRFLRRRRKRLIAAAVALVVVVVGVVVGLVTTSGSSLPTFTISGGSGLLLSSDNLLNADRSLLKPVKANVKFVVFDAGVTAIAEMRSGSVQAISGVGNPPIVAGIALGTDAVVVMVQSFDGDSLVVPDSITTPAQLAGKSVGVLIGSSEDFELTGWLKLEGLTSKVKVVSFSSEQAEAAAYVGGKIDAAYLDLGLVTALTKKPEHSLTDAEKIAKLGIPGLNVVAVSGSLIKQNPALVQQYVCAEVAATRDLNGANAAHYDALAAKESGASTAAAVAATKLWPFIPLSQQLYWLGSTPNDTTSRTVQAYVQTSQFLLSQGRIKSIPSTAELAAHVDPTFVQKALAGDCTS